MHGGTADLRSAEAALQPNIGFYTASGQNTTSNYINTPTSFDHGSASGVFRTDVGASFKQLIFDFGAARASVSRAEVIVDVEKLKLADQAEDIALRTSNAFLNLLEQRALTEAIDRTLKQQRALAELVNINHQSGNGTKADLDRINAKVIETEALRSDINTAYQVSLDEFRRLTGLEPQRITPPKLQGNMLPKNIEEAVAIAHTNNPNILALNANNVALNHEADGLEASKKPRIDFLSDATDKHFVGPHTASTGTGELKTMLSLSYKIFDGGAIEASVDKVRALQQTNLFKSLDEKETAELNIRRHYLTIAASQSKKAAAERGLETAKSVNTLYTEQFQAGKRTVFEVLDSYTTLFTMEKNRINGQYEGLRATYGALRNMGKLCDLIVK